MITKEQIKLMIRSTIDDFNNQYPNALCAYFKEIENDLEKDKFEDIYFCYEKIYEYYNLDKESVESFNLFINSKNTLYRFLEEQQKLKNEKKLLFKFWISFNEWYQLLKKSSSNIFLEQFKIGHYEENYYDQQIWVEEGIDCHEDSYFKMLYGQQLTYPYEENITIEFVKQYLEMIYQNFLNSAKDGKYPFSIKINELFARFGLPYKIKNGSIKKESYKTSNTINKILNYEQFERKIAFSENMILHNDLMDKHTALEYIADSFCYFTSLFKGSKNEKNKAIAKMLCDNENSNEYKDIISEIDSIYNIVNGNYDIRHNEYYNTKTNEPREPLIDTVYIEYLYNRIYDFLYLVRLKYHSQQNVENIDSDYELAF